MPIRGLPVLDLPELPPKPAKPAEGEQLKWRERRKHDKAEKKHDKGLAKHQALKEAYTQDFSALTALAAVSYDNDVLKAACNKRTWKPLWLGDMFIDGQDPEKFYRDPAAYIQDAWTTVLPTAHGPKPYLTDEHAESLLAELAANNGSAGPLVSTFLEAEEQLGHINVSELMLMKAYIAIEQLLPAAVDGDARQQAIGNITRSLTDVGVEASTAAQAAIKTLQDVEPASISPAIAQELDARTQAETASRPPHLQKILDAGPQAGQPQLDKLKARLTDPEQGQGAVR